MMCTFLMAEDARHVKTSQQINDKSMYTYLSMQQVLNVMQLLDRATAWAKLVGCADTVHFHVANATVSLYSMLSSYPGPIELINIQVGTKVMPCPNTSGRF